MGCTSINIDSKKIIKGNNIYNKVLFVSKGDSSKDYYFKEFIFHYLSVINAPGGMTDDNYHKCFYWEFAFPSKWENFFDVK